MTATEEDKPSSDGLGPNNVQVSSHPIMSHKISLMRSSSTLPSSFRAILREVTYHLGYEATSTLKTRPVAVSVAREGSSETIEHTGAKLASRVALIPIMRSGLGMTEGMLELLPNAGVHHVGMYKKRGQMPVQYYNRLPRDCVSDIAYVLDPVVGTGLTVKSIVGILKKWGVPKIHIITVVASRKGLQDLIELHPDVTVTVGTIDELNEDGIMVPGMGDAGDRLFGTPDLDDDEALLHPSKRKRSIDGEM